MTKRLSIMTHIIKLDIIHDLVSRKVKAIAILLLDVKNNSFMITKNMWRQKNEVNNYIQWKHLCIKYFHTFACVCHCLLKFWTISGSKSASFFRINHYDWSLKIHQIQIASDKKSKAINKQVLRKSFLQIIGQFMKKKIEGSMVVIATCVSYHIRF